MKICLNDYKKETVNLIACLYHTSYCANT